VPEKLNFTSFLKQYFRALVYSQKSPLTVDIAYVFLFASIPRTICTDLAFLMNYLTAIDFIVTIRIKYIFSSMSVPSNSKK
jgi:hypothetical protein